MKELELLKTLIKVRRNYLESFNSTRPEVTERAKGLDDCLNLIAEIELLMELNQNPMGASSNMLKTGDILVTNC